VHRTSEFPWEQLEACARRLDDAKSPRKLQPMPGGASTRQFVRVHFHSGKSAVAMYFPDATQPEEVTQAAASVAGRWPFLQVHDVLSECKVNVPRILAEECDHGLILVEDLGDDTLASFLLREPALRDEMYRLAIRDLAAAQARFRNLAGATIVQERTFDFELLHWEVEHFREWALEALGIQLTAGELEVFNRAAVHIAREAQSWPRVFVHRDYQSRNLMVQRSEAGHRLVWIDFQDALMGPRVYDLVALLNDSYQSFTASFISERLSEYLVHAGLPPSGMPQLRHEFDWITVQRKLKDAGRFVYIDRVKGNSSFLRFVIPTIAKARLAIGSLSDDAIMADLATCLDSWSVRIEAALDRASE